LLGTVLCRGAWWKLPLGLILFGAAGAAGYHYGKKWNDERKKKSST
jgi:hypothetical protein